MSTFKIYITRVCNNCPFVFQSFIVLSLDAVIIYCPGNCSLDLFYETWKITYLDLLFAHFFICIFYYLISYKFLNIWVCVDGSKNSTFNDMLVSSKFHLGFSSLNIPKSCCLIIRCSNQVSTILARYNRSNPIQMTSKSLCTITTMNSLLIPQDVELVQ